MKTFEKIVNVLCYAGAVFSGICVVLMMVLISADVFARNILHTSVPSQYAIVQSILMPASFFPALPLAYKDGVLPKISNFFERAGKVASFISNASIFLFEIVVFGMLAYYSVPQMIRVFSQKLGVDGGARILSIYPVYVTLPFGFFLTLICVFIVRIRFWKNRMSGTEDGGKGKETGADKANADKTD